MKLTFRTKKLEKLSNDYNKCQKEFGPLRAKLFIKRLNDLLEAVILDDVRNLPGHYHELKGNRKGQWACDLDQPYRLVFTSHENPIPTNKVGGYIWIEIKGVEIIEIIDYHNV